MILRLAFAQLRPETGLAGALDACDRAAAMGAGIILFPEMWNNGYRLDKEGLSQAVRADSRYIGAFRDKARECSLAIVSTMLEKTAAGLRNTAVLIDRHGEVIQTYAKVHTCDFADEAVLTPGDGFQTCLLDTAAGPVKAGIMICFDREFPESARILMLQGAELILVPNACPMEINRLSQLRARAFENMLAIATCNYPDGTGECNGHSSLFDGIAYFDDGSSRDMCTFLAPGDEGLYTADLDLDRLRAYRKTEVHGNAYRHPDRYGLLLETWIEEPFIRPDHRA